MDAAGIVAELVSPGGPGRALPPYPAMHELGEAVEPTVVRPGRIRPPGQWPGPRVSGGSSPRSHPPAVSRCSTASTDCCRDIAEVSIVSSASVGSS